MSDELYLKHRPRKLKDIIGQTEAVASIQGFIANGGLPHVIMFSGPSGTGKTTIARILARNLGCDMQFDFREVNAAGSRGIDTTREIESQYQLSPIRSARVWLFEESHRLTHDAQSHLLKMTEDFPAHVWFMFTTTDPAKVLPTLRGRCTEIALKPLTEGQLTTIIKEVLAKEKTTVAPRVMIEIVKQSQGSARKALVILHQVLGLDSEKKQLDAVCSASTDKAEFLGRALMKQNPTWPEVVEALKGIKESNEDPEGIRRGVMAYASTVILGGGAQSNWAFAVLDSFSDSIFYTGFPGLVLASRRVMNLRERK